MKRRGDANSSRQPRKEPQEIHAKISPPPLLGGVEGCQNVEECTDTTCDRRQFDTSGTKPEEEAEER